MNGALRRGVEWMPELALDASGSVTPGRKVEDDEEVGKNEAYPRPQRFGFTASMARHAALCGKRFITVMMTFDGFAAKALHQPTSEMQGWD